MNGRRDELHELCESAVEGRLTADQVARLEQLVLNDPDARRFYVEAVHQHACLHWAAAEPAFLPASLVPVEESGVILRASQSRSHRRSRLVRWGLGLAAAAALLCLGIGLRLQSWGLQSTAGPVATLVEAGSCKWGGGSLPTEVGAELVRGRLRLEEGIARIVFSQGASITIEAPADLELVSPKRCVLHEGRLVAKVPPEAIGFKVDTPTAVVEDLGTEFGVNVQNGKSADVQVFDGLVDVKHYGSGRLERMQTGENLRFEHESFAQFNPLAERSSADPESKWIARGANRLIQISTATGHGKDAYIRPPIPMREGPQALLLVKNTIDPLYSRKAYLGMDLSPLSGLKVVDATLSLTFAPSGLGFASEVPDSTFAVYGLTDESVDSWTEPAIRWENAPANLPGGAALDGSKVALLGKFEIKQGVLNGTRSIAGPALVDFLNQDTNGMATLIIVRVTKGSGRTDLVHGFVGKHHPQLLPPTLKLLAAPR